MGTIRSLVATVLAAIMLAAPLAASAETQTSRHNRLKRILNTNMGMPSRDLNEMASAIDDVRYYDTYANLAADTGQDDGIIGYAQDVDRFYIRRNSAWIGLGQAAAEAISVLETFGYGASKGISTIQLDGTAYDGSTGIFNMATFGTAGTKILYASLGAGQTADIVMVAGGLDIQGDNADNEGFDLTTGMLGASGRPMIPGVDPAFKFCATITVTDVSDTDELFVALRKPETINATWANYDTYAAIGIIASAATAAIKITTEDDAGGATTTDTTDTWADTATKALCVLVGSDRAVTYTINGNAPTATAAFSFDSGEPVIPTIRFLHAGAADCVPVISNWSVSYQ